MPQVPIQRGAAVFERDRLRLGRPVAAAGAAKKGIGNWSLTSLQQRLVKTGGWLVRHARYYWMLLAEGHLTRRVFGGFYGGS